MPNAWEKFYHPDAPREWQHPSELRGPSSLAVANLAIVMLSKNFLGNDLIEALGLYLAAQSRFNVWYGEGAGGGHTPLEMAQFRASNSDILRRVYEVWKPLGEKFEAGDSAAFERNYSLLLLELRAAVAEICARIGEELRDFGNL